MVQSRLLDSRAPAAQPTPTRPLYHLAMNEAVTGGPGNGGGLSPPRASSLSSYVPPCEACRLTGTATFAGISGWLLYQRSQVERPARGHRAVLAVMSAGFLAASIARWKL